MMGRHHHTNLPPELAPEEAVLKYRKTRNDKDGPSKDQFWPDFSTERPANNPWNNRLFEIFLGDFSQNHQDVNVKDVSSYFWTYLQTLRTARRNMMKTTQGRTAYEAASQRSRIDKRKKTVRLTPFLVPVF